MKISKILPVEFSPLTMVTGRDIASSLISWAKCLIYKQGQGTSKHTSNIHGYNIRVSS